MALSHRSRAVLGALLFLIASRGTAQNGTDLSAVLTRVEGQVTLSSASRAECRSVRRAAQRQILRRGEIVHLPAGAQVTVICSTETLVSLTGPGDWVLEASACGQGRPLPESSYRYLASYGGRILPRRGSLLLELEPRYVEGGLVPILLSPRNTATLTACPRLVWTRVPAAVEYEIKLRGAVETSIKLATDALDCGPGSGPWRGLDVCSWAPCGRWPALEPEQPVSLSFGFRQTSTAPFRRLLESYEIHLLPVDDQRKMQERLERFAALHLDEASRLLLVAGAYAQAGLNADAIAVYVEALQTQDMPEARVTLGDLYLAIGLTTLADREYRQVLSGEPPAAARAAAELGLGHVANIRNLFDDARAHFERARDLYASLGLTAETEDARAAAARFPAQRGNDRP